MMADHQNSLERCLTSLEKTLKSQTGLPLLKKFIEEKYSGSENEDYILIVEFLATCQLILSDKLSDDDKFAKARKIAHEEENRPRQKINMSAEQLSVMQNSANIGNLQEKVKAVFDRNAAEGSTIHRVFIEFRDDALTQRPLCGKPKNKEKKKGGCEVL